MKIIEREYSAFNILLVLFLLCILSAQASPVMAAEEYDEEDSAIISDDYTEGEGHSYDEVITGVMDEFSNRMIIVNNIRHSFCKDIMIFNSAGTLIPTKDLDAAIEVKLFISRGCTVRINVLSYAH